MINIDSSAHLKIALTRVFSVDSPSIYSKTDSDIHDALPDVEGNEWPCKRPDEHSSITSWKTSPSGMSTPFTSEPTKATFLPCGENIASEIPSDSGEYMSFPFLFTEYRGYSPAEASMTQADFG